jgi:hypothetical protein
MTGTPQSILRASVAELALDTRYVHIREEKLKAYLTEVSRRDEQVRNDPAPKDGTSANERIVFVLLRDATNFGSGWHPNLDKEPGLSGARTTGLRLSRWLAVNGMPSIEWLSNVTAQDCARIFGQSLAGPAGELMLLFAEAWRQLGTVIQEEYGGDYGALISSANSSAVQLSQTLGAIGYFRDVYQYRGLSFPFLKRAQLAVYDLTLFCPDDERCQFSDLDQLTIFADNLVPHTLKLDGILDFELQLNERIEGDELIPSGSAEEIEIRAMAVHAVELLSKMSLERGDQVIPLRLSDWLWNRGQSPRYKARPRQRTRSVHY